MPYGAGVQTIVYDPSAVSTEITSYADLWDTSLQSSIGITSNFRVMNGMALKIAGESYNTEDIATIEQAGEKLLELAPNIRLIKDDNLQVDLLSGEVFRRSDVHQPGDTGVHGKPRPAGGVPLRRALALALWRSLFPPTPPNKDAAYAFIDYILRPEVSSSAMSTLATTAQTRPPMN